jgi:hypothetical protein
VDGVSRFPIDNTVPGLFSGRGHLTSVPAGTQVVSLSTPADCSNEPGPQLVTMPAGTSLRDTIEVTFLVTCASGLGIITRTTGHFSESKYIAYLCSDPYCDGLPFYIGRVGRNDTLVFKSRNGYVPGWPHRTHQMRERAEPTRSDPVCERNNGGCRVPNHMLMTRRSPPPTLKPIAGRIAVATASWPPPKAQIHLLCRPLLIRQDSRGNTPGSPPRGPSCWSGTRRR